MESFKQIFTGRKRWAALITIVVFLAAMTGLAYAYFTASGQGTGNATVGTATLWQVTLAAPAGGPLLPGDAAADQSVDFAVTNNSSAAQLLSSTAPFIPSSGGFVLDSATGNPVNGCMAAWFTVDHTNVDTLPFSVAAGTSSDGTVTVHMLESGTNQDACQGASPRIAVDAS